MRVAQVFVLLTSRCVLNLEIYFQHHKSETPRPGAGWHLVPCVDADADLNPFGGIFIIDLEIPNAVTHIEKEIGYFSRWLLEGHRGTWKK